MIASFEEEEEMDPIEEDNDFSADSSFNCDKGEKFEERPLREIHSEEIGSPLDSASFELPSTKAHENESEPPKLIGFGEIIRKYASNEILNTECDKYSNKVNLRLNKMGQINGAKKAKEKSVLSQLPPNLSISEGWKRVHELIEEGKEHMLDYLSPRSRAEFLRKHRAEKIRNGSFRSNFLQRSFRQHSSQSCLKKAQCYFPQERSSMNQSKLSTSSFSSKEINADLQLESSINFDQMFENAQNILDTIKNEPTSSDDEFIPPVPDKIENSFSSIISDKNGSQLDIELSFDESEGSESKKENDGLLSEKGKLSSENDSLLKEKEVSFDEKEKSINENQDKIEEARNDNDEKGDLISEGEVLEFKELKESLFEEEEETRIKTDFEIPIPEEENKNENDAFTGDLLENESENQNEINEGESKTEIKDNTSSFLTIDDL